MHQHLNLDWERLVVEPYLLPQVYDVDVKYLN